MDILQTTEFNIAMEKYDEWLKSPLIDEATKKELEGLDILSREGKLDIYDRFSSELEFGTGGLRGILGAGTNRMNIYTVRKATQGFANHINKTGKADLKIAIAYDSRINSDVFAKEAAEIMAASGITAYIYKELMPTPALSFAVRHFKCAGGIMITASHNPAKYNGYKAYDADGCQLSLEESEAVLKEIAKIDIFSVGRDISHPHASQSNAPIHYIDDDVTTLYLDTVFENSMTAMCGHPTHEENSNLKVVYTPLCGAGNKSVQRIFKMLGVKDVTVIKEQEQPDGNFPSCPYPNPEKKEALKLALEKCYEMAEEGKAPDILIATDPDCDRVGIAVFSDDHIRPKYHLLTGNEVGVLLLDFISKSRTKAGNMPKDPIAVKTIVTTGMCNNIAKKYGVEIKNVLTGFKFIGEQIKILEDLGCPQRYILGFEESYGYLNGSYVRDKDAVGGSMLICEMAATYKAQGRTLVQVLEDLYKEHGYYQNNVLEANFEGAEGMIKMASIMNELRQNSNPNPSFPSNIEKIIDYMDNSKTGLPAADVLEYMLDNGSSFIIRPSGTEPKIKMYLFACGDSKENAEEILCKLSTIKL